jgi:hypothetical protein
LFKAAITLTCNTNAVLVASDPAVAAVATAPMAVAVTLPELVAVADCVTLEVFRWLAKIGSVMGLNTSPKEWRGCASGGADQPSRLIGLPFSGGGY